MDRRTGAGRAGSILLVTVFLAACGGSPPATPAAASAVPSAAPPAATAAPTPTPSPSPTPVADVSAPFVAKLTDAAFEGAGPITGTMSVGPLEGTISGAMGIKGADSAVDFKIEFPGLISSSSSSLKVAGKEYTSEDGGPWFEVDTPKSASGFDESMKTAARTVTDAGIVTIDGQQLHHMVPTGGNAITAADIGVADPSMADAKGTIDFYARDDGSLALMTVTMGWKVKSGKTPLDASMTINFAFDEDPAGISIQPPDVVWTRYASKRHGYSIGYPADWTVIKAKTANDVDMFAYSSLQVATAMRERQPKAAADKLDAYVRAFIKATPWGKPLINEAVKVGDRDAWRLAYSREMDGEPVYILFTLMVDGRNGYQVAFIGPAGYEDDITAFHEAQLTTFVPGG